MSENMEGRDEFGDALDELEGRQRAALTLARVKAREALAALKPFKLHEGRILPGLERGVADEVARLEKVASNLEALSTLHLEDQPATAPIAVVHEAVDEGHAEAVKAARAVS